MEARTPVHDCLTGAWFTALLAAIDDAERRAGARWPLAARPSVYEEAVRLKDALERALGVPRARVRRRTTRRPKELPGMVERLQAGGWALDGDGDEQFHVSVTRPGWLLRPRDRTNAFVVRGAEHLLGRLVAGLR